MNTAYRALLLCILFGNIIFSKEIKQQKISDSYLNNFYQDEDEEDDYEEWIPQQEEGEIGTAAGRLHSESNQSSDVINLAGLTRANTHLCTKCGVEISFTGRTRTDFISAANTKYFNNRNLLLDSYAFERSTYDLGISASAGKQSIYQKEVISLAADFRSRFVWGQPEKIASTTVATINDNGATTGAHNHSIGIPVLYLRGLDLTCDLNALFCSVPSNYPTQKLKLGLFPVEIGRGITLGAGYAVTPDVLSYAPSDVIQEFAPGIMLYGTIEQPTKIDYRLYLSIIKNNSANHGDLLAQTRSNFYHQSSFPYRGAGVVNIIGACQIDWRCILDRDKKAVFSPYLLIGHEGAGKIELPEDSISNLVTYGFEFAAENNEWELDFECAINNGSQYVIGIDRNSLKKEQRICTIDNNPNSSVTVITNDKVLFGGYNPPDNESMTTDIANKPAVFLGNSSQRQLAIKKVPQSSLQNGKTIFVTGNTPEESYTLINSPDRFRDPYQNFFTGYMLVFDLAKNICFHDKTFKWAWALGYASGDDHPNKSLLAKDDHTQNGNYGGFIGIQEIYSGKFVRSAFLMQGSGRMPRIGSIPAGIIDEETGQITESVEFPSPISGFNNLIYGGTSLHILHESIAGDYNWKWQPNLLFYWQPDARSIHNQEIIHTLGKNSIDPFLGTEVNVFLEIISRHIEGLKFFLVGTIFLPGGYYSDISKIPLDKTQQAALKKNAQTFIPLMNTNNAYYLNLGIEFKF
jgi:hypothetical protein